MEVMFINGNWYYFDETEHKSKPYYSREEAERAYKEYKKYLKKSSEE